MDETNLSKNDDESYLKPELPSESDCCNSGCNPCVFDLYELRLKEWQNKVTNNKISSTRIRYDLLSDIKFKPFIVINKYEISNDIYSFKFQPKLGNTVLDLEESIPGILPYKIGQHLVIRNNEVSANNNSPSVERTETNLIKKEILKNTELYFITRAYTPISLSAEEINCCFNIVVKLYKNGKMSEYFYNLKVGDTVHFRGPYGNFQYTPNSCKTVFMFCMGTGIAPMYPVAKYILNNESDETMVKLLYGCRQVSDIILRDELRNMASFWNFSVKFFLTDTNNRITERFGESFNFGRITDSVIFKELETVKNNKYLILICGSNEFGETILNSVLKFGAQRENVFVF